MSQLRQIQFSRPFRRHGFRLPSTPRKPRRRSLRIALIASICVCAGLIAVLVGFSQKNPARNALWEIVNNLCVPGQTQNHDPRPCTEVDLDGGVGAGFAILKDIKGMTQFLLIPTARISGIESPAILQPDAPNYFASAWQSRSFIDSVLHRSVPRDDIGLAINSVVSRSQDDLHIHIDCVRTDVFDALHKDQGLISNTWAPFTRSLVGHQYFAMWVPGENLGSNNPFRLLAERLPGAAKDMGDRTLVVIGFTRADGALGFVILADRANTVAGDFANGEELLDHSCQILEAPQKTQ